MAFSTTLIASVQGQYIQQLKWASEQSSRQIGLITVISIVGFLAVGGLCWGVNALFNPPPSEFRQLIQQELRNAARD